MFMELVVLLTVVLVETPYTVYKQVVLPLM
jgi:hypothetical protein